MNVLIFVILNGIKGMYFGVYGLFVFKSVGFRWIEIIKLFVIGKVMVKRVKLLEFEIF